MQVVLIYSWSGEDNGYTFLEKMAKTEKAALRWIADWEQVEVSQLTVDNIIVKINIQGDWRSNEPSSFYKLVKENVLTDE